MQEAYSVLFFFFFNDTATTEIYTLSLHDALPIWMTGCWRKATPLCTVADGWVVIASFAAGPAVAVAVNVTGFPVMPLPAAVAVSVFGPAVVPRVHDVSAAIPPAPVVTGVVGLTLPPPAAGANVP